MYHASLFVVLSGLVAVAAPVPKPDPEAERIAKVYGTISDSVGSKLSMDDKNALTVKMEKVRPPKKEKPGVKEGLGLGLPEPCGVSFVRAVKGDFSAAVKFRLKNDLTERPEDNGGVSVSLQVEYPSGEVAAISGSFNFTVEGVPPFKRKLIVPSHSSYTSTGKAGTQNGKSSGGGGISGLSESILGPVQMRLRCVGKKLILEEWAAGKWVEFDSLKIQETGEGKLTLSVKNYHGDISEVIIESYEVKCGLPHGK